MNRPLLFFTRCIALAVLLLAGRHAHAQTIAITSVTGGPFCPGATNGVVNFATVNPGAATASITITAILSNADGVTYPATPVNLGSTNMVIPMLAGTGSINLSIPYDLPGSSTYTLSLTSSFANSTLPSSFFQIYPTPAITNTPAFVCSGTAANITLTSNVPSTFSWPVAPVASDPSITGGNTGSGPTITDVLANSGTAPGFYTYQIIATSDATNGTCTGQPKPLQVNVNPVPGLGTVTNQNQIVCSGGAVSAITFTPTATGGTTTFNWTATNNTGTGIGAGSSGDIAAFTAATNATTAPQVSNGTVTSSFVNAGGGPSCPGTGGTFSLTVNPAAVVSPITNPAQIVCSGGAVSTIGFATTATGGTTAFNWTATNNVATGIPTASGTGDVAAFTANTNNGTGPQVSNGTVTPAFTNTSGGPMCNGTSANFTVSVNPKVVVGVISNQDQIVCSGGAVGPINFSSTVTGGTVTFDWSATNNVATGLAATGSGNIGSFTAATNNGTGPQVSNGTVTPKYVNAGGGPTCAGTAGSFSLTVNPKVVVSTVTNQNQIVCSGGAVGAIGFSTTATGGSTTFAWTATNASGTGIGASGNGNIPGFSSAANAGTAPQVSTGTVTPSFTNTNGGPTCAGTVNNFNVTVNPVPTVASVTNQNPIVCSGGTVPAITFNPSATGGTTTFAWTATNAAGTGIGASGNTSIIPSFSSTPNAGTAPQVSNGVVTPSFTNTNGGPVCAGTANNFSVTVNPVAGVSAVSNAGQIVCSGAAVAGITFTPKALTGGATSFAWTATNSGGTGIGASGNGNITGFNAAANATTAPQVSNGTVTASFTNTGGGPVCAGTGSTFSLTVNPAAVVSPITPQNPIVCSGGAVPGISFATTATGGSTTFGWTATNPAGTGIAASGNGNITGFNANPNGTTGPQVSNGTVTPNYVNAGGGPTCAGTPNNFSVTVNPVPGVLSVTNQDQIVCSGAGVSAITFNPKASGGTTSYTWTATNSAGTGIPAGPLPGNVAAFTANVNNSIIPQVSNGSVSTSFVNTNGGPSCTGTGGSFSVTVNPSLSLTAITNQNQIVCSSSVIAGINFSPAYLGGNTTYPWTRTGSGATGLPASSTGNIAPFAASANNANAPVADTGTVTPTFINFGGGPTCTGAPAKFVITVNPLPKVNLTGNQTICNGDTTTTVIFSGPTVGSPIGVVDYKWTNNNLTIGLPISNGTGTIGSFTGSNTSTSTNNVATFTVTPSFANLSGGPTCNGLASNFTVTVKPASKTLSVTPGITSFCSGLSTNITVSSTTSGATFSWSVAGDTFIKGATPGFTNSIAQMLTNDSNNRTGVIVYTINSQAGTCPNGTATVPVTVFPRPNLSPSVSRLVNICSGTRVTIQLAPTTGGSASYSWTTPAIKPAITGLIPRPIPATGTLINDSVVNQNTAAVDTGYYVVTTTDALTGCTTLAAKRDTIRVRVHPAPATFAPSPTEICSGERTKIPLIPSVGGSVFTWTVVPNTNDSGIGGAQNSNPLSPVDTIAQSLFNNRAAALVSGQFNGTILYRVAATSPIPAGSGLPAGCRGRDSIVSVVVRAVPSFTPANTQPVCSGKDTLRISSSNTFPVGGIDHYNWTSTGSTFISPKGSGTSTGAVLSISQLITNASNSSADTIYYAITPFTFSNNKTCAGNPVTVKGVINPTPVLFSTSPASICSGETTNIALGPLMSTQQGTNTFGWSVGSSVNVTGQSADTAKQFIAQQLTDTSFSQVGWVTYIVNGRSAAGCPTKNPLSITDTVKPLPKLLNSDTISICSESRLLFTPSVSVTPDSMRHSTVNSSVILIPGLPDNAFSVNDSLSSNHVLTPDHVVYIYSISSRGCRFDNQRMTVTVNPVPESPEIEIAPDAVCVNNQYVNVKAARSSQPNEVFAWGGDNGVKVNQLDSANRLYALYSFPNQGQTFITLKSKVRGANSCWNKGSSHKVTVNPSSTANPRVIYFAGNLVCQAPGVVRYQWGYDEVANLAPTTLSGEISQNYRTNLSDTKTKMYWVIATFSDSCSRKAYFNAQALGVAPATATGSADVTVYPNPATEQLNVVLPLSLTAEGATIDVFDLSGKRLLSKQVFSNKSSLSVGDLAPGAYILTCTQAGMRVATTRFIKN